MGKVFLCVFVFLMIVLILIFPGYRLFGKRKAPRKKLKPPTASWVKGKQDLFVVFLQLHVNSAISLKNLENPPQS